MSVSLVLIVVMAALYACGVYLLLERSMTRVLLGFLLVGNATNILILLMSGRRGAAPVVDGQADPADFADPLPQAFVLTAIVITFGISAFMLALIYRSWRLAQGDTLADDAEDLEIGRRGVPAEEESEQGDGDDEAGGDSEFGSRAEAAVPADDRRASDDRSPRDDRPHHDEKGHRA
jgi:multicomponent Na+:H+ antiporter subunit C